MNSIGRKYMQAVQSQTGVLEAIASNDLFVSLFDGFSFSILAMSILRVLNEHKLIICFDRNQNRLDVRHNLIRK